MERNEQYPHLDAYRDMIPEIDRAIETLDDLIDSQDTYFVMLRELKTILFRLTNERFLERIKKENDEKFLQEVEKATPHKETIEKLIEDINLFDEENKKLLAAIIQTGKMDSEEFDVLYPYLYTLAVDTTAHDRIPPELVGFFGENTREKCSALSVDEYAIFCYLLIRIKAKGRYSFAHPHLADELVALVEASREMPPKSRVGFYLEAAEYYKNVARRADARTCYEKAATVAKENSDLEASAYAMQKYYRLNQTFPKSMQVKPDEKAIEAEYGKFASIVLKGVRERSLKVDPVEFTEGFPEAFQKVRWKVEAQIDKEGDFRTGYQRWYLMEEYFSEMKIRWRCPKLMNPDMMFD